MARSIQFPVAGENPLVILPAYQEAGRIGPVVTHVRALGASALVVDDGSSDDTSTEARRAGAAVIRLPENEGKGAALAAGFDAARTHGHQAVVTMDADGQHDPADLTRFFEAYRRDDPPVLIGNRFGDASGMPRIRRLTNRVMSGLLSWAMGQPVPDTQNGYRLYRLDVLTDIPLRGHRFEAESEILLELAARGIPLASVEVATIYGDERSKIRPVRDTLRFLRMLRRFWWAGRRARRHPPTPGVVNGAGTPYTAATLMKSHPPSSTGDGDPPPPRSLPSVVIRGMVGGVLMGLANLVPGISGGTMLLAAGVYPAFIEAVAEVTTLRFRSGSLVLLGSVVGAAALAILLLAGPVKGLVLDHRWIMYSLFIGLTLGGLPVVWAMARPVRPTTWVGAGGGFIAMALLGWMQMAGVGADAGGAADVVLLFLAGVAGASAMILPGVSGGYLLLVLGQYVPILAAIERFTGALGDQDFGTVFDIGLRVGLPVGLGVIIGIAAVSNLLRWLLNHARNATLGALLGLLLGAVVGLWPFQESVAPVPGDTVKGQVLTETLIADVDPEDYPTRRFRPAPGQVAAALGLIGIGFALTLGISRVGGREPEPT